MNDAKLADFERKLARAEARIKDLDNRALAATDDLEYCLQWIGTLGAIAQWYRVEIERMRT